MLEKCNNREFCFDHSLQATMHLDEEQRIAAEIEEVLLDANLLQLEQCLPNRCNGLFHLGLRKNDLLCFDGGPSLYPFGSETGERQPTLNVCYGFLNAFRKSVKQRGKVN